MKSRFSQIYIFSLFAVIAALTLSQVNADEKHSYNVSGLFVEGCSCAAVCGCEMMGLAHGCEGVGAFRISSGTYNGMDLTGVKIAYAGVPGEWIRIYVDTNPKQHDAAVAFGKAALKEFGTLEEMKEAKIDITGKNGKYTLQVDNGKVMALTTEPVLGGDKKTAISHTNVSNTLNPTMYQGKTISGSYSDGEHSFELKDSNSFFNNKMKSSGKI